MARVYEIYDRRTTEQIDERSLDEAITKHLNMGAYLSEMSEDDKIENLEDAGFRVRVLPEIQTNIHGITQCDHIEVTFNYPEKSIPFDLHMEEWAGKKYLCVEFFDLEPNMRCERMFDASGTEKSIEWCSSCEEEVVLDAIEFKEQKCPSCGEPIRACHLCSDCKMQCQDVRSNS